jgi:hypothetical protein
MFIIVKIFEIKEIITGALYAVHWTAEADHSLDKMAEQYQDAEFLHAYFEQNKERLDFFRTDVQNAVIKTMNEANELIQQLFELAKNSAQFTQPDLDSLFVQLHKEGAFTHPRYYTDFKAVGRRGEAPWIRIYAIKCESNLYVITGYGIKLVRQMQDDPLLIIERDKLERASRYLKKEGYL